MSKIAFFSTRPYDRKLFENASESHTFEFFETRLREQTINLTSGFDGVCVFVNDRISDQVLKGISEQGVKLVALRCAGFNNVDLKAAKKHGVRVMRVPAYSPEAVAEHALALMMTLVRKTHKAYNRVRDGNFSLDKLTGFTIHGKTVGIIGTGQIGQAFCRILNGMGAKILAYDKYPSDKMKEIGVEYKELDEVLEKSDILSLHCPLTPETHHIINEKSLSVMKKGAMLINTSRGKLVDTMAVIEALKNEQLGSLAIDVYEEEEKLFFRDLSEKIIRDDQISRLMIFHNVLITAHQGFFTQESLDQIKQTTLKNFDDFQDGNESDNDVSCELIKDC
ncbi:MAG: 2-hydroxyacid dehydrogenase [Bacteroidetes bacterium]|nr:MAG: 2-hydroxyacid dehydrogenase [Bacteroidota bacterium]